MCNNHKYIKLDDLIVPINIFKTNFQKYRQDNPTYKYLEYLLDLTTSALNTPLQIMVMGSFSVGKSSFINALFGQKIAEVSANPTTAIITKIVYGTKDTTTVYFKNGTSRQYSKDQFYDLTTEKDSELKRLHKDIDYVERALPVDILQYINLIDSPGLDANKKHTLISEKFIDSVDRVFWMTNAENPLNATEYVALESIMKRTKPIIILNKIDCIDEDEGDSVSKIVKRIKLSLENKVETIIPLSAEYALEGQKENDDELLEESNLHTLVAYINEDIIPNTNNYKTNKFTILYTFTLLYLFSIYRSKLPREFETSSLLILKSIDTILLTGNLLEPSVKDFYENAKRAIQVARHQVSKNDYINQLLNTPISPGILLLAGFVAYYNPMDLTARCSKEGCYTFVEELEKTFFNNGFQKWFPINNTTSLILKTSIAQIYFAMDYEEKSPNHIDKYLTTLEENIEFCPYSAFYLGIIYYEPYFNTRDFDKAIKYFTMAKEYNSHKEADNYLELALAAKAAPTPEELFNKALELDKETGHTKEVLDLLEDAFAQGYYPAIETLFLFYDDAIPEPNLKRIKELEPLVAKDDINTQIMLVKLYVLEAGTEAEFAGNIHRAYEILTSLSNVEDNSDYYLWLGFYYEKTRDIDKSIKCYKESFRLAKDHDSAMKLFTIYSRGYSSALDEDLYKDRVNAYIATKYIPYIDHEDAQALFLIALLYCEGDESLPADSNKFKEYARKAYQLDPENDSAAYLCAKSYYDNWEEHKHTIEKLLIQASKTYDSAKEELDQLKEATTNNSNNSSSGCMLWFTILPIGIASGAAFLYHIL